MGATSKVIAIALAIVTLVLWVLAFSVNFGWLTAAYLYNQNTQELAIYGVIALVGTVGVYEMDF